MSSLVPQYTEKLAENHYFLMEMLEYITHQLNEANETLHEIAQNTLPNP
jgi:hypothetical protein